ncbi:MAG: hypothetical protein H7066_21180 [Cytophagaceae bacterium]|nr:hypothetical protein [Gemmatimonadaceae bacterium]
MPCRPSVTRVLTVALLSTSAVACSVKDVLQPNRRHQNHVATNVTEVNGSGIGGNHGGTYTDGDARVTLSGYIIPVVIGHAYIGHVHQGTCAAIGIEVQTLPVSVGRAADPFAPNAPAEFETLVANAVQGLVVDFHTTINGVDRRVACGSMTSRQA